MGEVEEQSGWAFETRAVHAGQAPDEASGAVVVPITLSTTFAQDEVGVHKGFEYSRSGNPTRHALEVCLASLEEARHGLAFASGLAAEDNILRLLRQGQRILLGNDAYGGTFRLIDKVWAPLGFPWTAVDLTDLDALDDNWPADTGMVWLETPTNPLLTCIDIEAIADVAHRRGALVVVDNTFATPYLQRPITLGADVVVHSATKYLGGHSDVVGGFIAVDDDGLAERLRFTQNAAGAVPAPFDCYLVLRGVKTLGVRMDRHCENARAVVDLLAGHPAVERVLYPQLPDHPGHAAAAKQMRDYGGMVSFTLAAGEAAARQVAAATRVFTLAESLGAVESLIEHPGAMTHASVAGSPLEVPANLVRLSVGIEHSVDLVADLDPGIGIPCDATRSRSSSPRNRLPVTRTDDGWEASPGGLVRALFPLLRESGGTWIGWTGVPDDRAEPFEIDGVQLHPVTLSADDVEAYYEGFSNDTLWPLYHDAIRESGYHEWQWEAYVKVNQRFADTLAEVAPPDAMVWIHDYHLQLVPQMLRERRHDVRIGFFNHIPFPPYELFARIPWREEIVEGSARRRSARVPAPTRRAELHRRRPPTARRRRSTATDVRCNDQRHSCRHVPDLDRRRGVRDARRRTRDAHGGRARSAPALGDPEVILLGVDRLDYTKGIGNRLRTFGALLDSGTARSRAPRARAGGHADPRGCRPVHRRAPRHRARRR